MVLRDRLYTPLPPSNKRKATSVDIMFFCLHHYFPPSLPLASTTTTTRYSLFDLSWITRAAQGPGPNHPEAVIISTEVEIKNNYVLFWTAGVSPTGMAINIHSFLKFHLFILYYAMARMGSTKEIRRDDR